MISLIVAHDNNRCVGSNGDMPWGKSIKSDLKWFKENTQNKIVVMGSKTFDSIGKALPNRVNVILTRDDSKADYYRDQHCYVTHTINEVLNECILNEQETVIIGGAEVYNQFLPIADRLYITHIDAEFEGDTFFPEYDLTQYNTVYEEEMFDQYPLKFAIYEKK